MLSVVQEVHLYANWKTTYWKEIEDTKTAFSFNCNVSAVLITRKHAAPTVSRFSHAISLLTPFNPGMLYHFSHFHNSVYTVAHLRCLNMLPSNNRRMCINVTRAWWSISDWKLCVCVTCWCLQRSQTSSLSFFLQTHTHTHAHTHIHTLRAADGKPNSVFSVFPFQKATNYIHFSLSLHLPLTRSLSLSLVPVPLL